MAGGHDLPGLDARPRDHAVGVRSQHRIRTRVPCERKGTLRTEQATPRLLGHGLLPVEGGARRIARTGQGLGARQIRLGLAQRGRGRARLRFRLLGLEPEIDLVEPGQRLPSPHHVPDPHEPARHLPGNPEAEIRLNARLNGPDQRTFGSPVGENNFLNEHWARGWPRLGGGLGGWFSAGSEEWHDCQGRED